MSGGQETGVLFGNESADIPGPVECAVIVYIIVCLNFELSLTFVDHAGHRLPDIVILHRDADIIRTGFTGETGHFCGNREFVRLNSPNGMLIGGVRFEDAGRCRINDVLECRIKSGGSQVFFCDQTFMPPSLDPGVVSAPCEGKKIFRGFGG